MSNNNLGRSIAEIFSDRYVIPIYQRNFAWRTDEIQQLLQDIFDAYGKDHEGYYYIGSLVVLKRHTGEYEVIDGQQRLTVLSLIAAIFEKSHLAVLSYDSRPEVQEFFELLANRRTSAAMKLNAPSLFYLKEAYAFLENASIEQHPSQDNGEETSKTKFFEIAKIEDYFWNHVILVRNEMPEDTDVASYFEIMNNRGEQLQKHEIVKAQMMASISCLDEQQLFAKIWDACSQMDHPIQRLFTSADKHRFFGDGYDKFLHGSFHHDPALAVKECDNLRIPLASILDEGEKATSVLTHERNEKDNTETDVYTYGSIIDFPNFLMHVFRLYASTHQLNASIPLDEKNLLSVYDSIKAKTDDYPIEFVELLLFCRAAFDRFIVKTSGDINAPDDPENDDEDGQKWILVKPTMYQNSWKYTSSFGDSPEQKKLIKALSMLQVTYRQRINKKWLYAALEWLYTQCFVSGDFSSIKADSYLKLLHGQMLTSFNKLFKDEHGILKIKKIADDEEISRDNSYSEGTGTPHFLFNFIDYLYCCQSPDFLGPKREDDLGHSGFDFKYWNSVEHHYAREVAKSKDPNYENYIHNLGNLCLVSRGANSRLSDRIVKEKIDRYSKGNLGPNRQIIYSETKTEGGIWDKPQIRRHYNELVDLLNKRESLLGLDSSLPKA